LFAQSSDNDPIAATAIFNFLNRTLSLGEPIEFALKFVGSRSYDVSFSHCASMAVMLSNAPCIAT
jgi:hypothetical protein